MHPILLKLGPVNIYSYGVMVAVGFGLAAVLLHSRAPKFGIDRDKAVNLLIVILISGIAGARLLYVIVNSGYYGSHPMEVLDLSRGGLIWYGGFAAGFLASAVYARINGIDFWSAADLIAPYLALGQAFGRIGCCLNGCCYGVAWPGNALFDGRHPTQLYSAALLFIIFIALLKLQDARRFGGEVIMGYCLLYSGKRFLIEFLRGDNPKIFLGLTMSQLMSAAVFVSALLILGAMAKRWKMHI